MRLQQIVLSAFLFGSAAMAAQLNERQSEDPAGVLAKRQQFQPTTTTAQGDTCAAAFGDGYVTCREATATSNRFCYNPSIGQSCCTNTWACPNGSFCLVDNYCCPNGQDAASCATANGVSLPSNFNANDTTPFPAGNATTTASGTASKSASPTFYSNGASSVQVGLAGIAGVVVLAGML